MTHGSGDYVDQWLCMTINGNEVDAGTVPIAQDALDSMSDQINNYQDEFHFGAYGPSRHDDWRPNITYPTGPTDRENYFEQYRQAIENAVNEGNIAVADADAWLNVDDDFSEGYGNTAPDNPYAIWDGTDDKEKHIHLARALDVRGDETHAATSAGMRVDNQKVTGIFVIHETAHLFNVHHHHGEYEVKDTERFNTSPLAAAYVCNYDGEWDNPETSTCYGGSGNINAYMDDPAFCNRDICEGAEWCYGHVYMCDDDEFCAHTAQMTAACDNHGDSTMERIQKNTPLPTTSGGGGYLN